MTKEKILEAIKEAEIKRQGGEFDLRSDTEAESLFYELALLIDLPFYVGIKQTDNDGWTECDYWSEKLKKTVIWNSDVGNFDDYDEVADFIINTSKEIKDFEERITLKK